MVRTSRTANPGGDGSAERPVVLDVSAPATVNAAVARTIGMHGRLDLVVNNAALPASGPVEATSPEELTRLLDIDVVGPHRVVRSALPHLRRSHGAIVLVSSGLAAVAVPFRAVYGAAKAAAEHLADGLAVELSGQGVAGLVVQPGPIATGFGRSPRGVSADRAGSHYEALAERVARDAAHRAQTAAMDANDVAEQIADQLDRPREAWPSRLVIHPEPDGLRRIAAVRSAVSEAVLSARGYC